MTIRRLSIHDSNGVVFTRAESTKFSSRHMAFAGRVAPLDNVLSSFVDNLAYNGSSRGHAPGL